MEYKILSNDEKNCIIVEFLLAQERDHYCHTVNKERYEKILSDDSLEEGEFKSRIRKLKKDIDKRIAEVEMIIMHTLSQLPSPGEMAATIKKIKAERDKTDGRRHSHSA